MRGDPILQVPAEFASRAWRSNPHNRTRPKPTLDNSGQKPIVVPGFGGCPVDFEYYFMDRERFAHGANDWTQGQRLTVKELAMLRLMNGLTDRPNWNRKVFDDETVEKWREEAMGMPLISEKAWEWCLDELQDKVRAFEETGYVPAFDTGSGCIKSDTLISEELRRELVENVQPLLDIPETEKDWQPRSNKQVLNLVHPSLYPLVYGHTRVLSQGGRVDLNNIFGSCGKGEIAPVPCYSAYSMNPESLTRVQYPQHGPATSKASQKFQWLPCEVEFRGEGNDVRITSYINNLHPRNRKLYTLIEKIIGLSIEPWNQVLVYPMQNRTPARIKTYGYSFEPEWPEWAMVNGRKLGGQNSSRKKLGDEKYNELLVKVLEYMSLPDNAPVAEQTLPVADPANSDDEMFDLDHSAPIDREDSAYNIDASYLDGTWHHKENARLGSAIMWKWQRLRKPHHPDPGVAYSFPDWKAGRVNTGIINPNSMLAHTQKPIPNHQPYTIDLAHTWRTPGLQIIVKLASIELTPQNPEYAGGSWHIEGMLNEHICATSIYYFDSENITSSSLTFRQESEIDDNIIPYENIPHEPLSEILGMEISPPPQMTITHSSLSQEPKIQTLGSISTPQNRLLVFPNTLQHRVEPFRLVDETKAGHRRMLVLWLVDPNYRVVSTRNVPPQRYDWWAPEAFQEAGIYERLPRELADMVVKEVGEWPMGRKEADGLREELMDERTGFGEMIEDGVGVYNFCEH